MDIIRTIMNRSTNGGFRVAGAIAAAAGMAVAAPALGQDVLDEHYEWEADEGVHEEEWYDPSDWWDDDFGEEMIDFEADWWETGWDDDRAYDEEVYYYYYDLDRPYAHDERTDYDPFYNQDRTYYDNPYIDYGDRDQQAQRDDDRRTRQYDQQRDMRRPMRQAQLRGELEDWTTVQLRGQPDAHTLVRLRVADGTSKVVNLGPNVSLTRLDLDSGDRLEVFGDRGQINGRDVLMAKRMRIGETTVVMDNWDQNVPPRRTADRQRTADQRQWQRNQMDRQAQRQSGQSQQANRQAQGKQNQMHPKAKMVNQIIDKWPEASKQAAKDMLKKYGKPDGLTPHMLMWEETGPFVKTVVYGHTVDHNFPMPHKDVLEQYVNFDVPADRMDELAKFDGSVVVYLTDGLMSARCNKEAANILALNLAADVVKKGKTPEEARKAYAEAIKSFKQGSKPELMQRLTFDSAPQNTKSADAPGEAVIETTATADKSKEKAQSEETRRARARDDKPQGQ